MDSLLRQIFCNTNIKGQAAGVSGLHPDFALMPFSYFLYNRQSQARALDALGSGIPPEPLKDVFRSLVFQTYPVIPHGQDVLDI